MKLSLTCWICSFAGTASPFIMPRQSSLRRTGLLWSGRRTRNCRTGGHLSYFRSAMLNGPFAVLAAFDRGFAGLPTMQASAHDCRPGGRLQLMPVKYQLCKMGQSGEGFMPRPGSLTSFFNPEQRRGSGSAKHMTGRRVQDAVDRLGLGPWLTGVRSESVMVAGDAKIFINEIRLEPGGKRCLLPTAILWRLPPLRYTCPWCC